MFWVLELGMFSVVIPNYNGRKLLQQCLSSLFEAIDSSHQISNNSRGSKQRFSESLEPNKVKGSKQVMPLEVIVVDNGSEDGSREFLREIKRNNAPAGLKYARFASEICGKAAKYAAFGGEIHRNMPLWGEICSLRERNMPAGAGEIDRNMPTSAAKHISFKVILNDKNLGFAAAVNQGIKTARSDYVVVMNNDIRLERNWFELMRAAILRYGKTAPVGAYFGTVLDWDGKRIESTGLEYEVKGRARNRDNGKGADFLTERLRAGEEFIWGAPAAVVVYYKQALEEIGFFDEDFFAYEEDVDLSLRLRGAGWRTLFVPGAVSYHLGGGTSRRMGNFRRRMDAKNWWFIIIKNYPLSVLIKNSPKILLERLKNLSGLLRATPVWRWPTDILRTYGEVLLKLPRMIGKRRPVSEIKDKT